MLAKNLINTNKYLFEFKFEKNLKKLMSFQFSLFIRRHINERVLIKILITILLITILLAVFPRYRYLEKCRLRYKPGTNQNQLTQHS